VSAFSSWCDQGSDCLSASQRSTKSLYLPRALTHQPDPSLSSLLFSFLPNSLVCSLHVGSRWASFVTVSVSISARLTWAVCRSKCAPTLPQGIEWMFAISPWRVPIVVGSCYVCVCVCVYLLNGVCASCYECVSVAIAGQMPLS
jgi:hypothetical protein